ncbi:MAG: hypothetical protein AB4050_00540 [Synechococcus sp.]
MKGRIDNLRFEPIAKRELGGDESLDAISVAAELETLYTTGTLDPDA